MFMQPSEPDFFRLKLDVLPKPDRQSYKPLLFSRDKLANIHELEKLLENSPHLTVHDELKLQIKELFKIRNPKETFTDEQYEEHYTEWCKEHDPLTYGCWVLYPWSNKLVHILGEEEFVELRTSRNKYKITDAEQKALSQKKIGVIGLSVGQSAAVTMAIERLFGTIRLADFDELELTNLNRIRRGLDSLALPKTLMVAREIAEIDPYLKVELFNEGITRDNLDDFIGGNGGLDLLVEECDTLEIKLLSRMKARERGIPVLMDTSDRGMIDIERFDLEPERPIFHDKLDQTPEELIGLKGVERVLALYKLAGGQDISSRMKASYLELEQTLTTWPQLASGVGLGGAVLGDLARKILLGRKVPSGRFYIDISELIPEEEEKKDFTPPPIPRLKKEDLEEYLKGAGQAKLSNADLQKDELEQLIQAGMEAPSSGNDQPWLFCYYQGDIFVFHELSRTYSFGDYHDVGSLQSIGAAIENIVQKAAELGISTRVKYTFDEEVRSIAQLGFDRGVSDDEHLKYAPFIKARITDRTITERKPVDVSILEDMQRAAESIEGFKIKYTEDESGRLKLGKIISACDRIRFFHPQGHYDFFHREMRWTEEEAKVRRVGMNIHELEIDEMMVPALQMLENYDVVRTLEKFDGGKGLEEISQESAEFASVFGMIYADDRDPRTVVEAGRSWERLWLVATRYKLSLHPMIAPLYMFPRVEAGGEGLTDRAYSKLIDLRKEFYNLYSLDDNQRPLFLFRVFWGRKKPMKSYRLPMNDVFYDFSHS